MKANVIVTIAENGDVEMNCDTCTFVTTVPKHLSESVFWDIYNGRALLGMLGHIKEQH